MGQTLIYRDVRYVIDDERCKTREWIVYPDDGPASGAARGIAAAEALRGSFKCAIHAAHRAIDQWLDDARQA